jgi:16S rRNA (cytidine1402-2'-O)-methyltransferase
LAQACPARALSLCRELTKQFETVMTLPARDLPAWLGADPNRVRGEFVVVLHGQAIDGAADGDDAHDALLTPLLAVLPLKQAVAVASQIGGVPRNPLYERALQLKARKPPVGDAALPDEDR